MILLALLIQTAAPQPAPAPAPLQMTIPDESGSTVIVTGESLTRTRSALKDCLKRQCPPKEDIARSLAYAEMQFLTGDYKGGRGTLLAARHRNWTHAAALPNEVADLHRALGRMTRLNGIPTNPRVNAADAVYALRAGLPADASAIFAQRLEVGDELAREGRMEGALQHYDWVAREARKAGAIAMVGQAHLRSAVLLSAVAAEQPPFRLRAQSAVDRLLHSDEPALLPYRNAARMIRVQLAPERDRAAVTEQVLATMEPSQDQTQMLVYAPMIDTSLLPFGAAAGEEAPAYADVSFRVMPDGRVQDIAPVTVTKAVRTEWLDAVTKALAGRRYTPRSDVQGSEGVLRLERYSFVAPFVADPGSRMPRRANSRQIDTMDLTAITSG